MALAPPSSTQHWNRQAGEARTALPISAAKTTAPVTAPVKDQVTVTPGVEASAVFSIPSALGTEHAGSYLTTNLELVRTVGI